MDATMEVLNRARPVRNQTPPSDRSLLASNTERQAIVDMLGQHTSAGRLTLAEYEQRAGSAYAARTLADLDRLLVDLPAVPPPSAAPRPGAWQKWVFASITSSWGFTALICLTIWGLTSLANGSPLYFWPMWVIGPWGAMIVMGWWGSRFAIRAHHNET
jgi:hypothetical protein